MKVKPKLQRLESFNPEDLENFHLEYIFPKDVDTRYRMELKIRQEESFYNDLYDEDIALQTEISNSRAKNKELDKAYNKFYNDLKSESLT